MTDYVKNYYEDARTRVSDQLITREDKLLLQIAQIDSVLVHNSKWNLYGA